ncbi:hypothetical protein M0R45_021620 [Rubus argutus]|uniref:Uncharacterized protein n=1 Tax=Rubus argutus TaxID=59490 RepID=A0AAW1XDM4_RUBAR
MNSSSLKHSLSLPLFHPFFSANPISSRSTCNIIELNCSGHRHREPSRCKSPTEPIAVVCCGSGRERSFAVVRGERKRGVASGAVMAGEAVAAAVMERREEWSGGWAWQRRRRDG